MGGGVGPRGLRVGGWTMAGGTGGRCWPSGVSELVVTMAGLTVGPSCGRTAAADQSRVFPGEPARSLPRWALG